MEDMGNCQICERRIQPGDKVLHYEILEVKEYNGKTHPWFTNEFTYSHVDCFTHWQNTIHFENDGKPIGRVNG